MKETKSPTSTSSTFTASVIGIVGGALIVFGGPYLNKINPELTQFITGASITGIGIIAKGASPKEIVAGFVSMALAVSGAKSKEPNDGGSVTATDILKRITELREEINQLGDSDNE